MPTDQVHGLKAHGSSPATGYVSLIARIGQNSVVCVKFSKLIMVADVAVGPVGQGTRRVVEDTPEGYC